MTLVFPPGFLWGTATSAYQVEGGNYASDWWEWERRPDTPSREVCGDACDHYQRYPEDIALLAGLGFNSYRFSVEWSRIQPEEGEFSRAELDHYRRVLACCREHGLTPIPTFHHFTLPRWVAAKGGWENPEVAELFTRYCAAVTRALGDLFDLAITINEPNIPALLGYEDGVHPPGKRDRDARMRASDTLIRAHRSAGASIRAEVPGVTVGLALAMTDWHAAEGGQDELERIRRIREDIFLEATEGDGFIGVNAYTRHEVGSGGILPPGPGSELTAMDWEYWPDSAAAAVRRAAHMCPGSPIFVTENGIGTDDDLRRIDYVDRALQGIHAALEDGIDIIGYLYWSALDNFEWNHGYGPRFGLIGVDRNTFERTQKPSAVWLGQIARVNAALSP